MMMRFSQPTMTEMMNRVMSDFNNESVNRGCVKPAVNIQETDQEYRLELVIPGMKKEDLVISLENDMISVSANQKEQNEESKENYIRKEFSFGSFQRSFTLPDTVDAEHINAVYENGVLDLMLPKKEEAKPLPARTIEIA